MYSSLFIGVARKKSFRSADTNPAPLFVSDIVLLMISFVSSMLAADDPASALYAKRSPPTVIRTRCGLDFKGQ